MHLPADIWVELFNKLTARDIASIACVCAEWNKIASPIVMQYRNVKKYATRWRLNTSWYPSYIPPQQQIYMFQHDYKNIPAARNVLHLFRNLKIYPSNPIIRILIEKTSLNNLSFLTSNNDIKFVPINNKNLVCDAVITAKNANEYITGNVKISPYIITIQPWRLMEVILNVGVICGDSTRNDSTLNTHPYAFKIHANGVCIYTRHFSNTANIQWLFDNNFQIPLCALAFTELTLQFEMNGIATPITDTKIVIRYAILSDALYGQFCGNNATYNIPIKTSPTDNTKNVLLLCDGIAALKYV